jgi:hypothetical protein
MGGGLKKTRRYLTAVPKNKTRLHKKLFLFAIVVVVAVRVFQVDFLSFGSMDLLYKIKLFISNEK